MKSIAKSIISFILRIEAILVLKKYKPKIIAVTGSVGKTSTKDAIFSVMSSSYYVRKAEKSFNSDIGTPLTILGCQTGWNNPFIWISNIFKGLGVILLPGQYPEWLVLEIGADRPGDIKNITKWVKPDVVVVTAFARVPVHIEFFAGREDVIREKRYLVEALKHDGTLVVNGDDDDAMRMKEKSKNVSLIYGTDHMADLVASDVQPHYDAQGVADGMTFKVAYQENVIPVVMLGSLGYQNVYSALAALSVGLSQKINLVKGSEALMSHKTPNGRMKIIEGINGSMILDDTYNASPVALTSALSMVREMKVSGRKIALLGDMLELGKHSANEHEAAGKLAAQSVDILCTVGIRSRKMAEAALDAGMDETKVFQCDDSVEAGNLFAKMIQKGDLILAKGSQSIRMEKAVKMLMAEPDKAKELLVRQDDAWENR